MKIISKFILICFLCVFVFSNSQGQESKFPDELVLKKTKLILNGQGERKRFFMTVYSLALYLPVESNNANEIYTSKNSMNLRLVVESSLLSKEKLVDAIVVEFKKKAGKDYNKQKNRLNIFISVFENGVKKNDIFDFSFEESKVLVIYKNGKKNKEINGLDFKQILYKIWLASNPVDDNLKYKLLGN